mmetsp:Transcript_25562/g.28670  ORF Transcript_25562/g.28670 Transcript_25562/m.28670 type:complete len:305 (-) Transcript_25562:916-1830(-)
MSVKYSGKNDIAERRRNNGDKLSNARPHCEECNENISLYQCPRCLMYTCSLLCCQSHKKRTGCSGKRNRGSYMPLCRMSDSTLRSDYFFIEEVLEIIPRARKISKLAEEKSTKTTAITNKNNHRSNTAMDKKARRLANQAERRGITLQIMPSFLERHKNNTSWYCGPRDLITWKVEVIIMPTKKTFSFKLSEQEEAIFDCISTHMVEFYKDDSDIRDMLLGSNYQLLIKRLPSSAKSPKYIRIEDNECLKKVLEGLTIIENPTIYCVPNESLKEFPIGTEKITERTDIVITEQASIDTNTDPSN